MTQDQQRAAIFALADQGATDYCISHATKLSVEQIRTVLGERAGR